MLLPFLKRRGAILSLIVLLVAAPHAAADLTREEIFNPGGIVFARLSPDGKHIASIVNSGPDVNVLLTDVQTMNGRTLVQDRIFNNGITRYNKVPRYLRWVGNDLIAVDYGVVAETLDLDGKVVVKLGDFVIGPAERDDPAATGLLVCTDSVDGDVALVDGRTGERRRFSLPGRGRPLRWAFDRHGELRAVTMVNSAFWKDVTTVSNWYKDDAGSEWRKLEDFGVADDYWLPLYVADEPNTLVVQSRRGRDTYAVFRYDTRTRQAGEMMAGHPTLDVISTGGGDSGAYLGVRTGGMVPQQLWFDPDWNRMQRSIDAALPHRVNSLSGDPSNLMLVRSYSDTDPGTWYLLDTHKMGLHPIGRVRIAVDPARMRPMEVIKYKAPDGLPIPAFLTKPATVAGPLPLVVAVHGGPLQRDYWGWNSEVQVLAAHGYAVFQPQFRGSTGFGNKFEQAGFGQWGLAMQDDITAGVQHLIETGVADPKRICIVGASYGGYAALWGLAKTPDLYRCGVSFAGVSDIELMFDDGSDRNANKVARELMRSRIGDAVMNKEKFEQVSPLRHADRIKAPVLLMHGENDERVPISHGEKMKQALEQQHKQVQWLAFPGEGHGLAYYGNQALYFETLLAFLDKHLGMPPAPEVKTE